MIIQLTDTRQSHNLIDVFRETGGVLHISKQDTHETGCIGIRCNYCNINVGSGFRCMTVPSLLTTLPKNKKIELVNLVINSNIKLTFEEQILIKTYL